MYSNDLLRGTLRTIVLKMLSDHGRMYGYELTQKVSALSKGGITLTFGALYPVLHKLESEELLITESEMHGNRLRKYYRLTGSGRQQAEEKVREFLEFSGLLKSLLTAEIKPS